MCLTNPEFSEIKWIAGDGFTIGRELRPTIHVGRRFRSSEAFMVRTYAKALTLLLVTSSGLDLIVSA